MPPETWHTTYDEKGRIDAILHASGNACTQKNYHLFNLMDIPNPTLLGVTECLVSRLVRCGLQYTRLWVDAIIGLCMCLDNAIVSVNPFEEKWFNNDESMNEHLKLTMEHLNHQETRSATKCSGCLIQHGIQRLCDEQGKFPEGFPHVCPGGLLLPPKEMT